MFRIHFLWIKLDKQNLYPYSPLPRPHTWISIWYTRHSETLKSSEAGGPGSDFSEEFIIEGPPEDWQTLPLDPPGGAPRSARRQARRGQWKQECFSCVSWEAASKAEWPDSGLWGTDTVLNCLLPGHVVLSVGDSWPGVGSSEKVVVGCVVSGLGRFCLKNSPSGGRELFKSDWAHKRGSGKTRWLRHVTLLYDMKELSLLKLETW